MIDFSDEASEGGEEKITAPVAQSVKPRRAPTIRPTTNVVDSMAPSSQTDEKILMVMNTEEGLNAKIKDLKKERKQQRAQRKVAAQRQTQEMTHNQKIFKNLQEDVAVTDHSVVPMTASNKMAHGRVKMQGPRIPAEEILIQDPDSLANIASISEAEARKSQRVVRETMGLENFQDNFLSAKHFLEKAHANDIENGKKANSPEGHVSKAYHLANEKLQQQKLDKEDGVEGTPTSSSSSTATQKRGKKRGAETEIKRRGKKARGVDKTDMLPPLTRNETAVVEYSNMRDLTSNETHVVVQISNTDIKPKPQRYKALVPTETAPSGNDAIRSMRRNYLISNTLNKEAEKAYVLHDETTVRDARGGLLIDPEDEHANDMEIDTPALTAIETRDVAVISDSFYKEKNSEQERFTNIGERNAEEMAESRRRPALVPSKPITTHQERETENGREPDSMLIASEAMRNVAAFTVSENADKILPLYFYVRDHTKPSSLEWMGWTENIVFDNKQLISSLLGVVKQYKVNNEQRIDVDYHTGKRLLSDEARQLARNIKKRRDPMGRQAEFDPTRLRMHLANHKVAFCITRWNRRDAMFSQDWPELVGGNLVEKEDPNIVVPDRRVRKHPNDDPEALIRLCEYGAIGKMLNRCRENITNRNKMTGTDYLVSVEELGTDRIHPSMNQPMPRVPREHHQKQMRQFMEGEGPCSLFEHCICNTSNISKTDNCTNFSTTNNFGFVCVRYLSEADELNYKLTGVFPSKPGLCIADYQAHVTALKMANIAREIQPVKPIHNHCVFVGPGQYSPERLLSMSVLKSGRQLLTGIVDFFPQFEMHDYVMDVRVENGKYIRFLRPNPAKLDF